MAAADPIVFTDRDDYAVADTVVVVGSGWQRGETVSLTFYGSPARHKARALRLVADSRGEIYEKAYVVEESDRGTSVTVVAAGKTSGLDAVATFSVEAGGDFLEEETATLEPRAAIHAPEPGRVLSPRSPSHPSRPRPHPRAPARVRH